MEDIEYRSLLATADGALKLFKQLRCGAGKVDHGVDGRGQFDFDSGENHQSGS